VSFDDALANEAIKTVKRCGTIGVSKICRMPESSQTGIPKCYFLGWLARW